MVASIVINLGSAGSSNSGIHSANGCFCLETLVRGEYNLDAVFLALQAFRKVCFRWACASLIPPDRFGPLQTAVAHG